MFKQKEYNLKKLLFSLMGGICLLSSWACSDREDEYFPGEEESVDVIFNIKSPSNPSTYAITTADENTIEEIDVLIFREEDDQELYSYRAKGEELDPNSSGDELNFKVTLKKDDRNKYRFVILANASKYIENGIATTGVKELVLQRVVSAVEGVWKAEDSNNFTAIPMWGETDITYKINENTNVGKIKMIRSLARVDVLSRLDPDEFDIREVYVYNWKKKGCVVPDLSDNAWNKSGGHAILPTLPASYDSANGNEAIKYVTTSNKVEAEIYIHEVAAVEQGQDLEATALVVGGYYKGNTAEMSYYRVDFKEKIEGINGADDYYVFRNILRNHKYRFTVASVIDDGFNHPDTAFMYKKANITVEITTWNMADQSDTEVKPTYELQVNQSVFDLNSIVNSGILKVTCDYPGGWDIQDKQGNIQVTRTGDSVMITATGSGSFVIKAGNLTKKITVNYN